ncbi:MAG: ABC transporter substrate-binding protein [Methylacidiphilales bacterium]|nr:ABC transporter substrate-binding protein [Candidatus Methylacidiphilales bacterium]MDW8349811.1 MqnA/MqnD/SBP family protein [Verrucomicrobiae bacterium]
MHLTLGHTPDADDAFMFYALTKGLVTSPDISFEHILQDIETLNQRALRAELDVTAVSVHAFAYCHKLYAVLPCGASFGVNFGPRLVGPRSLTPEQIARSRIAIPGKMTSAFLALLLYLKKRPGDLNLIEVPYEQVIPTIQNQQADIGLVIHEAQLTYPDHGLTLSLDLAAWWAQETGGLPLPLGLNVIRKSFDLRFKRQVAKLIRSSIQFALDHRPEALEYAQQFSRGTPTSLTDEFISRYVNDVTLYLTPEATQSLRIFLDRAADAGLTPAVRNINLEFVKA